MKEYIVKLTQTEAEALTYMVGGLSRNTPVINTDMFNSLENEVFVNNNIVYRHDVRDGYFSTLKYYGT